MSKRELLMVFYSHLTMYEKLDQKINFIKYHSVDETISHSSNVHLNSLLNDENFSQVFPRTGSGWRQVRMNDGWGCAILWFTGPCLSVSVNIISLLMGKSSIYLEIQRQIHRGNLTLVQFITWERHFLFPQTRMECRHSPIMSLILITLKVYLLLSQSCVLWTEQQLKFVFFEESPIITVRVAAKKKKWQKMKLK